jgi:hypothetical protein
VLRGSLRSAPTSDVTRKNPCRPRPRRRHTPCFGLDMFSRLPLCCSFAVLVLSISGCDGEPDGASAAVGEDDVVKAAFKNGDFACKAENASDDDGNPIAPSPVPLTLELRGKDVAFAGSNATYDSRYRPRKYRGYSRFAFEFSQFCGATPTLIVENKLLDGTSKTGLARYSTQSERCWDPDIRYTCTRL